MRTHMHTHTLPLSCCFRNNPKACVWQSSLLPQSKACLSATKSQCDIHILVNTNQEGIVAHIYIQCTLTWRDSKKRAASNSVRSEVTDPSRWQWLKSLITAVFVIVICNPLHFLWQIAVMTASLLLYHLANLFRQLLAPLPWNRKQNLRNMQPSWMSCF